MRSHGRQHPFRSSKPQIVQSNVHQGCNVLSLSTFPHPCGRLRLFSARASIGPARQFSEEGVGVLCRPCGQKTGCYWTLHGAFPIRLKVFWALVWQRLWCRTADQLGSFVQHQLCTMTKLLFLARSYVSNGVAIRTRLSFTVYLFWFLPPRVLKILVRIEIHGRAVAVATSSVFPATVAIGG